MIALLALLVSAVAGDVVVDAKVPARVAVGGEVVGDVYRPAVLRVAQPEGVTAVVVTIGGKPYRVEVQVPAIGQTRVLVGPNGITVEDPAAERVAEDAGPLAVTVRVAGSVPLMLQLPGVRHVVRPGREVAFGLPVGDHAVTVRSSDGGIVYARGVLQVRAGGEGLIQLVEGGMPETSGEGLAFVVSGR